jgi:hypothetical protein
MTGENMTTTTMTEGTTPDPKDRHVVVYALVDGETAVFVQCGKPIHLVDAHEVLALIIKTEVNERSAVDAMFEYLDGIDEWRGPDYVFGPRGMEVRAGQQDCESDSVGNDGSMLYQVGHRDGK